jgi:hypothetical protein
MSVRLCLNVGPILLKLDTGNFQLPAGHVEASRRARPSSKTFSKFLQLRSQKAEDLEQHGYVVPYNITLCSALVCLIISTGTGYFSSTVMNHSNKFLGQFVFFLKILQNFLYMKATLNRKRKSVSQRTNEQIQHNIKAIILFLDIIHCPVFMNTQEDNGYPKIQ